MRNPETPGRADSMVTTRLDRLPVAASPSLDELESVLDGAWVAAYGPGGETPRMGGARFDVTAAERNASLVGIRLVAHSQFASLRLAYRVSSDGAQIRISVEGCRHYAHTLADALGHVPDARTDDDTPAALGAAGVLAGIPAPAPGTNWVDAVSDVLAGVPYEVAIVMNPVGRDAVRDACARIRALEAELAGPGPDGESDNERGDPASRVRAHLAAWRSRLERGLAGQGVWETAIVVATADPDATARAVVEAARVLSAVPSPGTPGMHGVWGPGAGKPPGAWLTSGELAELLAWPHRPERAAPVVRVERVSLKTAVRATPRDDGALVLWPELVVRALRLSSRRPFAQLVLDDELTARWMGDPERDVVAALRDYDGPPIPVLLHGPDPKAPSRVAEALSAAGIVVERVATASLP